jgi:hypothetical protein
VGLNHAPHNLMFKGNLFKRKWPLAGPFFVTPEYASVIVTAMFDDHDPVVMVTMPAVIAMHFGACIEAVMIVPDHNVLGTCNRRRGDGDHAKRCNNVSKILHDVLLVCAGSTSRRKERSRRNPRESKENSEQAFIQAR